MGSSLLVLRLEGPLQSWGLRARWDVRDTGDEPSKSAVIGLLGCALGYPSFDPRLETLERSLRMGVREEHPGRRITDFQTISGLIPKAEGGFKVDPSTIISPRTYLQDAAFLVLLDGTSAVLASCEEALRRPHWPIYLGRKSCPPSRPVLIGLTDAYASLADGLARHPWDWEGRDDSEPKALRFVLEDESGEYLRPDRLRTNPARMYDSRAVAVGTTPFPGAAPRWKEDAACI
jgi:CRISPR system Cascade subunit CasD